MSSATLSRPPAPHRLQSAGSRTERAGDGEASQRVKGDKPGRGDRVTCFWKRSGRTHRPFKFIWKTTRPPKCLGYSSPSARRLTVPTGQRPGTCTRPPPRSGVLRRPVPFPRLSSRTFLLLLGPRLDVCLEISCLMSFRPPTHHRWPQEVSVPKCPFGRGRVLLQGDPGHACGQRAATVSSPLCWGPC